MNILTQTNVRIYSYKTFTRTNVRIYSYNKFDTNECPNKYLYWKLYEYWNIFEYLFRFYTLTHSQTNVRIYSYNLFLHEGMSKYMRKRKIDKNQCPKKYYWPIYFNIQYIRHTLTYKYDSNFWRWISIIQPQVVINLLSSPQQVATSQWWSRNNWTAFRNRFAEL